MWNLFKLTVRHQNNALDVVLPLTLLYCLYCNFEQIPRIVLVFLLLTLNRQMLMTMTSVIFSWDTLKFHCLIRPQDYQKNGSQTQLTFTCRNIQIYHLNFCARNSSKTIAKGKAKRKSYCWLISLNFQFHTSWLKNFSKFVGKHLYQSL